MLTRLLAVFAAGVLLFGFVAWAGEEEEELPTAELLEFLGEWESGQERWMDPLEVSELFEQEEVQDESDDENAQE